MIGRSFAIKVKQLARLELIPVYKMPNDLAFENGKDPTKHSKEYLPVQNGIDGFVKIENRSHQEFMHCPWKSTLDKDEFQLLLGRELESFGYTYITFLTYFI